MSKVLPRLSVIVKDPLLHFLAVGALLFLLLSITKPPVSEDRILVNRETLLTFIQYRSKAFESDTAAAILDTMTDTKRAQLIKDYIREEALYREAQKLGLDNDDYVIRMRMVQKVEFMTAAANTREKPNAQAIAKWYNEHKSTYSQQPSATFTHIYFSTNDKTAKSANEQANRLVQTLQREKASFEDATQYGERFLFHTNYIDRTYDYINSQFGSTATEKIFSDQTPLSSWIGPVTSDHGLHLLYVTKRIPRYIPALSEISTKIEQDMRREENLNRTQSLIDSIIKNYAPVIDLKPAPISPNSEQSK